MRLVHFVEPLFNLLHNLFVSNGCCIMIVHSFQLRFHEEYNHAADLKMARYMFTLFLVLYVLDSLVGSYSTSYTRCDELMATEDQNEKILGDDPMLVAQTISSKYPHLEKTYIELVI